jgi:ATP-dependent RNA helicase RhlE
MYNSKRFKPSGSRGGNFRNRSSNSSSSSSSYKKSYNQDSGSVSSNSTGRYRSPGADSYNSSGENRSYSQPRFIRRSGGGGYGRGGGGRRGGRGSGPRIDSSRYVRKAEIVEEKPYHAKHEFNDFKLDSKIKKNIEYKGYKNPTPIQDQTIPLIIEGKDVLGIANTGTGKTAAFLLPLINKVILNPTEKVLIIVPTRELAVQIEDEFRDFSKFMNIYSVTCIGGANIRAQMYGLKRRYNFIIGTPGRLKDLVNRHMLNLSQFRTIILDEVDRMLDMGFIDDISYLVSKFPEKRQSLFFSATLERQMEPIIDRFLNNPIKVSVKTGDTARNVDQDIVRVTTENKYDKLRELLETPAFHKVLIFTKTKIGADKLTRKLRDDNYKAESIHGDKSQYKRQQALDLFKMDKVNILIATDVAARGLDISNVSHVINYDEPSTYEDYVHRIGRTGRAGKKGFALTFVS